MNIDEYIKTRVDDQIDWYDQKSQSAQNWYKGLQIIEIILASFIPLLAGYSSSYKILTLIVGLFGALIAIIESITKLNKYHENWIQYRTTCEMLRYQKHLYLTGCSPYNKIDETPDNLFIRTVESIISSENNQWKNVNTMNEATTSSDETN